MEIKVGVREFRAKLPSYLDAAPPVAITRHGETIGYYVPARRGRTQAELEALREAATQLEAMLSAQGVAEDELVGDFKKRRMAEK